MLTIHMPTQVTIFTDRIGAEWALECGFDPVQSFVILKSLGLFRLKVAHGALVTHFNFQMR